MKHYKTHLAAIKAGHELVKSGAAKYFTVQLSNDSKFHANRYYTLRWYGAEISSK